MTCLVTMDDIHDLRERNKLQSRHTMHAREEHAPLMGKADMMGQKDV